MSYYSCDYLRVGYRSHIRTYGVRVISEPANEQITLEEARLHLRLDSYNSPPEHEDDQWILDNIPTARAWCEFDSGRSLAPKVLEVSYPAFPHAWSNCLGDELRLPFGPIAGVDSVAYSDSDGAAQVMDSAVYTVDISSELGYVYPIVNTSWPSTSSRPNAVRVRYQAGYTTPLDSPNDFPLPKAFKSAMLLVLGHLYENREDSTELKLELLPKGASALMGVLPKLRLGMA